jgi:hypothetical protein
MSLRAALRKSIQCWRYARTKVDGANLLNGAEHEDRKQLSLAKIEIAVDQGALSSMAHRLFTQPAFPTQGGSGSTT